MNTTDKNLPQTDGFRFFAISQILPAIALMVGLASLYLQYATSSFFEANASELTYWYLERNVVESSVDKRRSQLLVTLTNESGKDAHDVKILIKLISDSPIVHCNEKHDPQSSTHK